MSDTVLKDCADDISYLQVNYLIRIFEYFFCFFLYNRLYQKIILVFKII